MATKPHPILIDKRIKEVNFEKVEFKQYFVHGSQIYIRVAEFSEHTERKNAINILTGSFAYFSPEHKIELIERLELWMY
ncbi:MAG: hypothetical protein IPM51_11770 [Sphingobacteriaceae bacterium]|nr:hypothetical protein [Sphingobacteriaceae bacterium]